MPTSKNYSAVVKGGFWETNGVNPLANHPAVRPFARRLVAQWLGGSKLMYIKELADSLNGVAPGATATKSVGTVSASTELGGARQIVQAVVVNRVTTAADRQEIDDDFYTMTNRTTFGATPPINGDRNPLGTR
jgi:hypothetical protein